MRTVKPTTIGLALAAVVLARHLVQLAGVAMGWAEPHSFWSLSFPQTATLLIAGTGFGAFVIGSGSAVAWNKSTRLPRRYRALLAATLVILAGMGAGAWGFLLRPLEVQITRPVSEVAVEVFGLGTVEARVTSKVGFKVAGVLADIHADIGDQVAKGTTLARLDDREQQARIAKVKATKEQADATLERAKANLERAEANYANAKTINERRQELLKTNITSVEAAQTAKTAEATTSAEVSVAKGDILVARAAINDAAAQNRQESVTLDFHNLAAPYDAVVTGRLKELGSSLQPGEPVFTLIDPQSIWVLSYIDESKSGEIKVGDAARIALRSMPGRPFQGRVARIQPEGDRVNEERKVEVAFDRLPDALHIGEQAEVHISTVRLAQAILIPASAVEGLRSNRGAVWTVEDGHLRRREVTLGHRLLDGLFEVTGGVPANAVVVTQLQSGLRIGRAANIIGRPQP
jgi:HlyD family secretion protein